MYLMPWKFVCDLCFHEVLKTTIIKQITKGNEGIERKKKRKKSQKPLELSTNLCVLASVCDL